MRRYRRLIGTSTVGLILACGLVFKSGCGVDFAHKKDVGLLAGGLLAWLLLFQDNDLGAGTNGNGDNGTGDTGGAGDATAGAPADGRDGVNGINCWDLNADGIADVDTEDTNGDGSVDIHDCRGGDGTQGVAGAPGADGIAGLLGPMGPMGPQGPDGPTGPQGDTGRQGDTGQSGAAGSGSAGSPGEDGDDGEDGSAGLACWDLNGNGLADIDTEDTNGDGSVDVFDCRGLSFFDIFIDDYFGPPDGLDGSTPPATDPTGPADPPFVRLSEPVLGGFDFDTGRRGSAIAFRVAIPVPYNEGNDVTMRLTFHRTGELGDDCFKFKVDRARLRDTQDIELYPDPRYVTMDLPDGVDGGLRRGLADLLGGDGDAPGKTLVVDLPINIGETAACDGRMDGLGFWVGDLKVADLVAFELRVDTDDLAEKYANVRYHLLGVEFFEGPKGTAVIRGARIFDDQHPKPPCGELDCNENGIADECDLANCDGSSWCSDCNQNSVIDECDLCDDYQIPSVSTTTVECSMDCNMDSIPDECQELECSANADCEDDAPCTEDFCDGCVCVHIDIETAGPGIDTDDHVFIWDADTLRVSDIDTLGQVADFAGSATTCGGSSDSCGGFDDGRHMVFDTAGQRIFVSDHDRDFMVFDTSATQLFPDWNALNLSEPLGIAPLPNGQLLITDEEDSSGLFRINADLTPDIGITASRFDGAEGVVYDSVHDVIYVADEDDGEIEVFDGSTLDLLGAVPFCGTDGPYWLGVDGSSNRLFVLADSRCNVGGEGTARGLHVFDIGCRPGDLSYVKTFVGSGEPGSDCFGTLAVSESTDRLFAIDYCNDTVAIFDTATLAMLGSVPVDRAGEVPLMVSVGHLNDLVIEDN